jgi:nucleoside-diphosphate-sugar epimerase
MSQNYRDLYRGRRVLITGGLGFIGSNLARHLVDLGADVLLVDSLLPDYGGNLFNIAGFEDRLRVNIADVRQSTTMNYLVRGRELICWPTVTLREGLTRTLAYYRDNLDKSLDEPDSSPS